MYCKETVNSILSCWHHAEAACACIQNGALIGLIVLFRFPCFFLIQGEGLTRLQIGDHHISFRDALDVAQDALLGDFYDAWPLTKVLDIGGAAVRGKEGGRRFFLKEKLRVN